jgi:hypothetical protein
LRLSVSFCASVRLSLLPLDGFSWNFIIRVAIKIWAVRAVPGVSKHRSFVIFKVQEFLMILQQPITQRFESTACWFQWRTWSWTNPLCSRWHCYATAEATQRCDIGLESTASSSGTSRPHEHVLSASHKNNGSYTWRENTNTS